MRDLNLLNQELPDKVFGLRQLLFFLHIDLKCTFI